MAIGAGGVDLGTLQNAGAAPKLIRASKTFTGAANLGAVGVNELFTTTGVVRVEQFSVYCATTLVDAVDGATFDLGTPVVTDILWSQGALDLDLIVTGAWIREGGPGSVQAGYTDAEYSYLVALSDNIIMTISTQAITGGVLEFYVLYRGLSADGALSLGAGMVAI